MCVHVCVCTLAWVNVDPSFHAGTHTPVFETSLLKQAVSGGVENDRG